MAIHGRGLATELVGDETISNYLSTHRLFRVLPEGVCRDLSAEVVERHYSKGHHLTYSGDLLNFIGIVKSGLVALSQIDTRGDDHALMALYPGDVLGLGAAVRRSRMSWTSTAMVDVQALIMRLDTFSDLYQRFPEFRHQVACELANNVVRCGETALYFTLGPASSRVATFLLESAKAIGKQQGSSTINLSFSHQELADFLGMTRETVTRILARLSRSGIIATDRNRVTVLNTEALREMANG
ncbi:MAG: Crp/Fnr family transcriptional regulator [Chloroflexota bacterium]|jgi:CRP-like cAMP-binding protein